MKGKNVTLKRVLAFALALVVAFTAIPATNVFATETDASQIESQSTGTEVESTESESIEVESTESVDANVPVADSLDGGIAIISDEDTDGPGIEEGYAFTENGTEVESAAILHFIIKAYDYTGIGNLTFTASGPEVVNFTAPLTTTGNENEYTASFNLADYGLDAGTYTINAFYVSDTCANANQSEKAVNWTFTVKANSAQQPDVPAEEPEITVTLDKAAYELTDNDMRPAIIATVNVGTGTNISRVDLEYKNTLGEYYGAPNYFIPIGEDGTGSQTFNMDVYNADGTYVLRYVTVYYTDGSSVLLSTVPQSSFTYKNKMTDQEPPVFQSLTIDKNGQALEDDTVTFTVKATDATGFSEVWVMLESPLGNEIEVCTRSVKLEQQADGSFMGTLDVSELYPCEWYVECVNMFDTNGYNSVVQDLGSSYYFYVTENGTFVGKTYENRNFKLYDNNGFVSGGQAIADVTKTVNHRTTIGEIFGDAYKEPANSTLGAFVGWRYNNQIVSKDTVIALDEYTSSFSAIFEKTNLYLSVSMLDGGYAKNIVIPYNTTYAQLIDMLEAPATVNGCKFTGWNVSSDMMDKQVVFNMNGAVGVFLTAEYDKYPVNVSKIYVDESGKIVYDNVEKFYPAGTKLLAIHEEATCELAPGATGWKNVNEQWMGSGEINASSRNYFSYIATYSDKNIVHLQANYWEKVGGYDCGINRQVNTNIVVDNVNANSKDKIREAASKYMSNYAKDSYLTLKGWVMEEMYLQDWNGDGYFDNVYMNPTYDSYYGLQAIVPDTNGISFSTYLKTVTEGEVINLPTHVNGWNVKWLDEATGKEIGYTLTISEVETGNGIPGSILITAVVNGKYDPTPAPVYPYVPVVPQAPVEETTKTETATEAETTTKPSVETKVEETVVEEKPVVELKEEKIEAIKEEITKAIEDAIAAEIENAGNAEGAEGEIPAPVQVVVDMKNEDGTVATVVPRDILEVAKGKNVEVVLDMGEYSWTINGNDILASDLQNINLEVTLDAEVIPPVAVQAVSNGLPTRQLSLTHNGDFGFKANLTINVDKQYEGQFGNLYYYDSDGVMKFMSAGKIDADGNVSLSFTHASEYVVVIGDDRTEEETAKVESDVEGGIVEETVTEKSGSVVPIIVVVVIVIVIVVIAVVVMKKKNNEQ